MDEIEQFFNEGARPSRLRGPLTNGIRLTIGDENTSLARKTEHQSTILEQGVDYVQEAKLLEQEQACLQPKNFNVGCSLEYLSVNESTVQDERKLTDEALTEVYNKYSFKKAEDTNNFEITEFKNKILNHINAQRVVLIHGPTGCGKTTQVPQFILDEAYESRRPCKIVVTQPRRIAAISIAKRVAQERGWNLGGVVGYQVGLERVTSTTDTLIEYVTTGVLLQKLVATKTLSQYTHIILDEVHERNQDMDFLLLVVRKLLYSSPNNVKVILMSATMQVISFLSYFKPIDMDETEAIAIDIKKKNPMFSNKIFYGSQLGKFTPFPKVSVHDTEPCIPIETHMTTIKLLYRFDYLDEREDHYDTDSIPSVLIFLPGINEIDELYNLLNDMDFRAKIAGENSTTCKWWILPLHSTITADEQVKVFLKAPPGHRKIILATNIAESSITVPDIKYVIDYCLMKVLVVDDNTNFASLQLTWASKTNCEQRAGRAGRVRDGRVYRLVSELFYDSLPLASTPEMQRCPLERLVLLAKMLNMGSPAHVLALAMDPPDLANIHRTVLMLKEIGCLLKTVDGEWSNIDGDITYLGRICSKLPLDVRMSKLIVLGHIFGCLNECVIMAAAMSVKSLFSSPFQERLNSYNSRLTWADGSTSDCIAFYNAYKVWDHFRKRQHFKNKGPNGEKEWAKRFYVQIKALREVDELAGEIFRRLAKEGIERNQGQSPWNKNELTLIQKVVIAGAFYPQYFIQPFRDESREREAVKMLCGFEPRTTVYLGGFPMDQPGQLYASGIARHLRKILGHQPRVVVDSNSSKVLVTFTDQRTEEIQHESGNNPVIPGKVVLPVYKAVKARLLRLDIRVPMLPKKKAQELMQSMKKEAMELQKAELGPKLPDIDQTFLPIKISQFINCGRFWVQYDDANTTESLRLLDNMLNSTNLLVHTGPVKPGDMFASPYRDEAGVIKMHRVRVKKILPNDMVWLFYVDYGSVGRVSTSSLYVLPGACWGVPPLAVQCVLAEVGPALQHDLAGDWAPAATRLFHNMMLAGGALYGKVYSVVRGVVAIELFTQGGKVSVNQELIKHKYAEPMDESYDSKMNHDLRVSVNELNLGQQRAHNQLQEQLACEDMNEPELDPPPPNQCSTSVVLKGPFSPLESNVFPLLYGTQNKQVSIEGTSVNSVLLDNEPQQVFDRMLVAGLVSRNEENTRLTLRHTTMLPAIPGLPVILSLLFCPTMELRCDEERTRFVSALCGLGADASGHPLYPEHDMLINVDVNLDERDINNINHIRYIMDEALYCPPGSDVPLAGDHTKVVGRIRNTLQEVVWRHRAHQSACAVAGEWEWSAHTHTHTDTHTHTHVYPALPAPALRDSDPAGLHRRQRAARDLRRDVARTPISSNKEVQCQLCGTDPMSLQAMRIHLYSQAHQQKEHDLERIIER